MRGKGQERLWCGKTAAREQCREAPEDAFSRPVVQLLVGNGANQRLKRRPPDLRVQEKRTDPADDPAHHRIDLAEMSDVRRLSHHGYPEYGVPSRQMAVFSFIDLTARPVSR